MRWIPLASGNLPNDGTAVLVAFTRATDGPGSHDVCEAVYRGGEWLVGTFDEEMETDLRGVTHWQPLPAHPDNGGDVETGD